MSFICFFAAFLLNAFGLPSQALSQDVPWVPGQYIVKYNEEKLQELKYLIPGLDQYSNEELKDALTQTMNAERKENLPLVDAQTIEADAKTDIDVDAAVDLLDSNLAEYISPNFIVSVNRTPNDPSFSTLWGLNQSNNIDINAPEAWDVMTDDSAKDIIVGVVDTGVDYTHPDLAANMWVNQAEKNGASGVDDDGNGVVDDIYGYNAITGSGNPMDDHNHGTHTAGTIGAVGNNGVGITGVAWKVKLMALKFLSASGQGTDADAIKAINYAVNMRNSGGKLKVLSNSWGGSGYNPAMLAAIQAANSAGILFVAAAGNNNSNNDVTPFYPANYTAANVVSVAAVQQDGSKASFSNYGATTVSLAAPGVGILSTVRGGGYASYNGTSMATPHVSGVAALMYARVPQYTAMDVKNQLIQNVKRQTSLNGLMQAPGIVDAKASLIDPSNYPPDLAPIKTVTIAPNTRVRTIPLMATDREGDSLTYSAQVELPPSLSAAIALDVKYNFTTYAKSLDNYYKLGEKRIQSGDGKEFFIFADGSVYELQLPYYSFRGSVDAVYYQNPDLLVNASLSSASSFATLQIIPGTPAELRIEAAKGLQGSFIVSVTVSDGNRSDTEIFTVNLEKPSSCS